MYKISTFTFRKVLPKSKNNLYWGKFFPSLGKTGRVLGWDIPFWDRALSKIGWGIFSFSRKLIFWGSLGISFLGCSLGFSNLNYEKVVSLPHFVIYRTEQFSDPEGSKAVHRLPIRAEKIAEILNSFRTKENWMGGGRPFWEEELGSELSSELFPLLENSKKGELYLVIMKKEDPVQSATRLSRTTFYISRFQNFLYFQWIEIDKDYIFSNPYTTSDWAFFREYPVPCRLSQNYAISDSFENKHFFLNDKNCTRQPALGTEISGPLNFNRLYVYLGPEDLPEKKQAPAKSPETRLLELESLRKKGLLSEKEYNDARQRILEGL